MNTPIGRYRWLKLPFGIQSSPEIYQTATDEVLEGIDHAYAIMYGSKAGWPETK